MCANLHLYLFQFCGLDRLTGLSGTDSLSRCGGRGYWRLDRLEITLKDLQFLSRIWSCGGCSLVLLNKQTDAPIQMGKLAVRNPRT